MHSLPEECLLHLMPFVARDARSLHALLLTSSTLFRLSAQILYRNPFAYLENHLGTIHDKPHRLTAILRLLLSCAPATLQDLPPYRSGSVPLPRRPTIDYLSLCTSHLEKLLPAIISMVGPQRNMSSQARQSQQQRPLDLIQLQAKIHAGLVGHSPQHIHTIGFSTHLISVLQPLVGRLSSLVRLELFKKPNRPDLSSAVGFIASHRQHFSTLQEIKITLVKTSEQSDLSSLIEAMGEPRVVDVSHWASADQHLDKWSLERCRVLLMRFGTFSTTHVPDLAVLSRCTQLEALRMSVFHQDMFSWASTQRHGASDAAKPRQEAELSSISLYGIDSVLVPALLDACDAFRVSIRELTGLSSFGKPTTLTLTWNWPLLHLTRLDLEGTIAVQFDLTSLAHCPLLQELRLNIGRTILADWDVQNKARQLTCVSAHLRDLELSGWWRLPDSALTYTLLPVLERLHRLNLMWCTGPSGHCLIELVPQLRSLSWLAVSMSVQGRDDLLLLKTTLGLTVDMDINLGHAE